MASQSPCPLMCNGTTISTIKLSSHFSSAYGSVSFVSKRSAKRSRFVASSLRDSSSSSTSTSSPSANTIKNGLKKSLESECSCSCSTPPNQTIELIEKLNGNVRSKISRRSGLSFKSLFGRRALWRRIFFASKKVRSILLLNVITVVYASNIPVVKEVEAIMDPAAFTVVRFAVSAIPFIPFIWRAKDDISIRNAGFELGIWVSLGYLMQALGLQTSDAGRASFISTFTVIVVPLLDGMLGAIVPARTWFGALMSILGVALLESSGSPPCVGDLLNFLGAVFFGVHMLRTEHIARNTKRDKFLPLLGYEVCVVAFMSTLWYLVGGWSGSIQGFKPSSWTLTLFWDTMISFPWIPTLYTGVFSTGLCLWIEMAAMRDVSATETAIIYGLEPVWGAGFAWFLLGERWGYAGWFGASLVLVGSLTVQIFGSSSLSKSSKEEKTEEKLGLPEISDNANGPSASPVVVHSREDRSDLLR